MINHEEGEKNLKGSSVELPHDSPSTKELNRNMMSNEKRLPNHDAKSENYQEEFISESTQ